MIRFSDDFRGNRSLLIRLRIRVIIEAKFGDSSLENIQSVSWKDIWDKVLKNGPSKICGRQPLKYLKKTISL